MSAYKVYNTRQEYIVDLAIIIFIYLIIHVSYPFLISSPPLTPSSVKFHASLYHSLNGLCHMAIPTILEKYETQWVTTLFRVVTIPASDLDPVVPSRGDKVKVILGDEDKDQSGQLLSIDSQV